MEPTTPNIGSRSLTRRRSRSHLLAFVLHNHRGELVSGRQPITEQTFTKRCVIIATCDECAFLFAAFMLDANKLMEEVIRIQRQHQTWRTQPDVSWSEWLWRTSGPLCTPVHPWRPRGDVSGAVGHAELQQTLRVHLVEQPELGRQLVRLLPLGGELGALLVVVVVRQLFARVRVPSEGPEAVQVDLVAHGRRQRVHEDARAQALRRQLLGFPVTVGGRWPHGYRRCGPWT